MTRLRLTPPDSGDAEGFVLVGVVMFILVLTILGLSLFSLSGFEAQFFNASLHRQDSHYAATAGIERARWVLTHTTPPDLENVKQDMPPGVTFTTARQGPDFDSADSTSDVLWNSSDPVWIRVLAENRGMKSYIEARFTPEEPEQIYKRVITSYTGITATTRPLQVELNGPVWQNSSDLSWTQVGGSDGPVKTGGAPMPDVLGFYAAYLNTAQPAALIRNGPRLDVYLNTGPSGGLVFYRTAGFITNSVLGGETHFHVRGTAVWMLPDGIDMEPLIQVHGGPSDRLIVVARRGPVNDVGISFDAMENNDTPLILVSDSGIRFTTEWNSTTTTTNIPYVTMFAKYVTLAGPEVPHTLRLSHDAGLDDAVLEPLYEAEALPNTLGGAGRTLTLQAGTWRQLPTTGL